VSNCLEVDEKEQIKKNAAMESRMTEEALVYESMHAQGGIVSSEDRGKAVSLFK